MFGCRADCRKIMKTLITINNETFVTSATPKQCIELFEVLKDIRRVRHGSSHGPGGWDDNYHCGNVVDSWPITLGCQVVPDGQVFTAERWREIEAQNQPKEKAAA